MKSPACLWIVFAVNLCQELGSGMSQTARRTQAWDTQVHFHFSLCQLLIMLNYTFNTSGSLWTFLRVWGQAFPVSVNDPTSGELSYMGLLLSHPPSFTLSGSFSTPHPLSPAPRTPPFTNDSDSWGLTRVTYQGSLLSNTNKQEKARTPWLPHVHVCMSTHAHSCISGCK